MLTKTNRRCVGIALGLTASLLTFAAARADDPTIKIGASISKTGLFAREGEAISDGIFFWAKKVNDTGGIHVGGKTYKVQIISYDDASDAQTSARLTEKLITEDGVKFLFGPYSSGITIATAAQSERYHVMTMAPMTTANGIYERGYKYIFTPSALGNTGLWPVLEFAQTLNPKPQTLAVVGPDDIYPNTVAKGAEKKAAELGMKLVYTGRYPKGTPDLTSLATNIKASNPDIVLTSGATQDSILLVRALNDLKAYPKIIGIAGAIEIPDFRKSLGPLAAGVIGPTYWTPQLKFHDRYFKDSKQFATEFEAAMKKAANFYAACGTASGIILEDAIDKAQSLDSTKVRAAMLEISGETFYGKFKFNPNGSNSEAGLYLSQIIDGKPQEIFPPTVAQAHYIYPRLPPQ